MFGGRKDQPPAPRVAMRLVHARDRMPLSRAVTADLLELTKRGARLMLADAFIDGVHITLGQQGLAPLLAQVTFGGDGLGGEPWSLVGRIASYHLDQGGGPSGVTVDLLWEDGQAQAMGKPRTMRALLKQRKPAPAPEA